MADLEQPRLRPRPLRVLIRLGTALAVAALSLYIARRAVIGAVRELDALYPFAAWAGVALAIVGFAWIIRIAREDPDASESSWRFRDF